MTRQNLKHAIRAHQQRTGTNYTTARRAVLEASHPSPAPFLAQAASSTDPRVLQAITDLELLARHLHFRRVEFAARIDGTRGYTGARSLDWSRIPTLTGIVADQKPGGQAGRWKRGPRSDAWVPAVGSKFATEFQELNRWPHLSVPGADAVNTVFDSAGQRLLVPILFAHDGAAWLVFSTDLAAVPGIGDKTRIGTNWRPERHSDAIQAMEGWNEKHANRLMRPLTAAEEERVRSLHAGTPAGSP